MTIVKRRTPTHGQNLIVVNSLGESDRMKKIREKERKEAELKRKKSKSKFDW